MKNPIAIGALIAVLLLVAAFAFLLYHPAKPSLASVSVADAPWPVETDHLRDRLAALDLPALSEEGTALHIHEHLDIFIHGTTTPVPSDIGVHESVPAFISPLHTHDTTGIIHVESPTVATFTLGQFFDIWGVRLTSACIGSYCSDGTNTLSLYVDGKRYEGDPRALELAPHQELVILYGSKDEAPSTIPASYTFPEGY